MDKIYINLSPKQEKTETAVLSNLPYYLSMAIAGCFIIVVLLGIFIVIRMGVSRYYQGKWSKWKEQYTTLSKIKNEISRLEVQKNELNKILTPQNQMAKIFNDIFASLPQNVWFSSMALKKDSLDMKGYVVKVDEDSLLSLEKFINNLKSKEYFSSKFKKVNIKNSQETGFNGIQVLEFDVECAR